MFQNVLREKIISYVAKDCYKKWFEKLNMKSTENENEIKKLRICCKHFSDEDYNGSSSEEFYYMVQFHL